MELEKDIDTGFDVKVEKKDKSKHSELHFNDENTAIPKPVEKKKKVGVNKKVSITFRHNRAFELHIGQEVMRFEGRETKPIDKGLLGHPSFIQARKYFIIKGV